ncbi:Maleylacetoacetate isomerase [Purpureocillium takamizusanense]|uniref:Maleylacetoacetate isomerase n=1 Tax=Purpureocillium takamizusanense TaxID=2060973 RepID=A0A9Q8QBR0_9HYPO|nr:Maleylacetoacetate isomerase [Purpureocillium takamizusanense]UNI15922.1 Maleylacetoacetate isomerase [Purpureocillium takamizusanense]
MSDYTLYSYYRSSCSARLRIALNLKGIDYELVPVNLLKDEQLSESHRALNPSATVPLLVVRSGDDKTGFKIGQSVAALEYIDEVAHQEGASSLLPPARDARGRAIVRTLAQIISADTQPVTNLRIMRRVRALGGSAEDWNKELMTEGLRAYEAVAQDHAGRYSFGDSLTIADACLMPAVWNAERFGVDVKGLFPTIAKVAAVLEEHPAVKKAHYFRQPDTPDNLRID